VGEAVVLGNINFMVLPTSTPVGSMFKMLTLPLCTARLPVILSNTKSIALPFELSMNSKLPDLGII
jgi:hypothetical protein